jgi:hypothetical protein
MVGLKLRSSLTRNQTSQNTRHICFPFIEPSYEYCHRITSYVFITQWIILIPFRVVHVHKTYFPYSSLVHVPSNSPCARSTIISHSRTTPLLVKQPINICDTNLNLFVSCKPLLHDNPELLLTSLPISRF